MMLLSQWYGFYCTHIFTCFQKVRTWEKSQFMQYTKMEGCTLVCRQYFTATDSNENITNHSWNQLAGFAENNAKQNIYLWVKDNSSGKRSGKPSESNRRGTSSRQDDYVTDAPASKHKYVFPVVQLASKLADGKLARFTIIMRRSREIVNHNILHTAGVKKHWVAPVDDSDHSIFCQIL